MSLLKTNQDLIYAYLYINIYDGVERYSVVF
jgi:hypothetical protein